MKYRGTIAAPAMLVAALMTAACGPAERRLAVVAAATNGPVWVEVALSTNAIPIGRPIEARARIDRPAGARVECPEPGVSNLLRVLHAEGASRPAGEGRERMERRWHITSFDLGRHRVWTGEVAVATDSNEWRVPMPAVDIEVVSVRTNGPVDLRPPKGPLAWAPTVPRWVWVLALVAVLAAGLAGAAVLWLRRRPAPPPPPPPPPHRAALADLERLRQSGAIEAGQAEYVFVELSRIVRVYIEARFELRAPERTTEEFLREAADSGRLSTDQQDRLRAFLQACDLVKFARAEPSPNEMREALDAAERFVRETAQPEPDAATPGGGA